MMLRKFASVQFHGVHPTNPITGVVIPAMLQWFMVTRDVDGDVVPADALYPRPTSGESIAMSRMVGGSGASA